MNRISPLPENFIVGLEQVYDCLLILLVASFPYNHRISSTLTVLLIIIWLSKGSYKRIIEAFRNKYSLVFIFLFLISIISLLFSEHKSFFPIEKRLSILIFPILLCTSKVGEKVFWSVFYFFAFSCSAAAIYTFARAVYLNYLLNSLSSINRDLFATEMTNESIGISHVYFGLYLSFTIVILCHFILKKKRYSHVSLIMTALIAFLLFFLFLLGAKMAIISLILISLVACLVLLFKAKRFWLGIAFLALPITVFLVTINSFAYAKYRYGNLLNPDNYFIGDNAWNSIGSRITIFKCSYDVYLRSPFLGTGIGDVQYDLNSCYEISQFTTLAFMNPHNQFIQFLLETGIVGLICFLTIIIYSGVLAWRARNNLYLCFLFLFSFCCLTESLLERQQGIMFFAFFSCLFSSSQDRRVNELNHIASEGS